MALSNYTFWSRIVRNFAPRDHMQRVKDFLQIRIAKMCANCHWMNSDGKCIIAHPIATFDTENDHVCRRHRQRKS